MTRFFSFGGILDRIRPQIFLCIAGLTVIGLVGLFFVSAGGKEITGVCVGGIIALAKDLIDEPGKADGEEKGSKDGG